MDMKAIRSSIFSQLISADSKSETSESEEENEEKEDDNETENEPHVPAPAVRVKPIIRHVPKGTAEDRDRRVCVAIIIIEFIWKETIIRQFLIFGNLN